jgi:hypothetical protein
MNVSASDGSDGIGAGFVNGIDGITEAHRSTWTRLTRLRAATTTLPDRTTYLDDRTPDQDRAAL